MTNPYCEALGIAVPQFESAKDSPDANYFALLIVALLEHGGPLTLEQVARRFEEAGIAAAAAALASLKRCKPGRPPIYREGDLYSLDPYDHETDLWAFRLGLRPSRAERIRVVRPDPGPLPSPDEPLTLAQLDELLRDPGIGYWSAQRVAICVLDAHRKRMMPRSVAAFVSSRARHRLSEDSSRHWRAGSAVRVVDDGSWSLEIGHDAVRSARQAARDRIEMMRRWARSRPDPAVVDAVRERIERERMAHAGQLAGMTRVILHSFPLARPAFVVLLDVGRRHLTTLTGEEVARAREVLSMYDVIAALDARQRLRALGMDPTGCRLADLGPPQKSYQLNRRGRTLRITTSLLIQGTCDISRPLADSKSLTRHLKNGEDIRLRRRLEADAKALHALYRYGRLHGYVRLRWGFLDDKLPAPWKHPDEPGLYGLMHRAHELHIPLEVVTGSAPGWDDPWVRAQRVFVHREAGGWRTWMVGDRGVIREEEVQLARLAGEDLLAGGAP